jgi:hypothetical protein
LLDEDDFWILLISESLSQPRGRISERTVAKKKISIYQFCKNNILLAFRTMSFDRSQTGDSTAKKRVHNIPKSVVAADTVINCFQSNLYPSILTSKIPIVILSCNPHPKAKVLDLLNADIKHTQ